MLSPPPPYKLVRHCDFLYFSFDEYNGLPSVTKKNLSEVSGTFQSLHFSHSSWQFKTGVLVIRSKIPSIGHMLFWVWILHQKITGQVICSMTW